MSEPAFCSAPVPAAMATAGLSWPSLIGYARKAVDLLQAVGDTAIDAIEDGFQAWAALSGRDFTTLFAEFASAQRNIQKIIDAVKKEFGLE